MRNLGSSGLRVSEVGLGCNNFGNRVKDVNVTRRIVDCAIDAGITLFDTADVYGEKGGSETQLGEVLGEKRKKIVLATKFGMQMNDPEEKGASRRYILSAVEASLRRLRTDWIDLYQLHQADPRTPVEETLRALDDLIRQGKVRYIGCSNVPAWQVADAQWIARELGTNAFVSCQDEYSLLVRKIEKDLIPAMQHFGLGLLPYFPLASGLLTGKYRRDKLPPGARLTEHSILADRYLTESNWSRTEKLEQFCEARGRTLVELAFSWLLSRPAVASVIAGATKPEQVEQNVNASGWELSAEDLAEIDRITA